MERKTAFEIVKETIDFYTANPDKRAAVRDKLSYQCRYLLPNGNTCAVGRCMIEPKVSWGGSFDSIVDSETELALEPLLKEEYRGQPDDLWRNLQDWHDSLGHWDTEKGLSEYGKARAEHLLKEYANQ